jgi:hypothetical protein
LRVATDVIDSVIEEYKQAVEGINLTKFAPSHKLLVG